MGGCFAFDSIFERCIIALHLFGNLLGRKAVNDSLPYHLFNDGEHGIPAAILAADRHSDARMLITEACRKRETAVEQGNVFVAALARNPIADDRCGHAHLHVHQRALESVGPFAVGHNLFDVDRLSDFGMAEKGSFCRSIIVETASIYFTECCARTFPVGEFADDFAFNLDRIDRANNHQPCAVGHIPFAIQCLHLLCRSVLQNVQLSDRIAGGKIAVGIEQFARGAVALETEILPVAHLGDDDAAFAVDRARIERNFACRFAHQEKRAFDQGWVCLWKIQFILRTNKTG